MKKCVSDHTWIVVRAVGHGDWVPDGVGHLVGLGVEDKLVVESLGDPPDQFAVVRVTLAFALRFQNVKNVRESL